MDGDTPLTTLRSRPDWMYLLQDLYEFYRAIPAGGSAKIRSHQRAVRERISKALSRNAPLRERAPTSKPVLAHLTRAFARARLERHAPFMATLETIHAELEWLYGYEKVPRGLEHKFAFAELAGPNGPVVIDDLILGLVLFAPGTTYPAHAHDGITESYICLTGAVSENDTGVYAPGSLIFNPPGHLHRITTADQQPSLLAYAWVGAPEALANQKMTFSRKKGDGKGGSGMTYTLKTAHQLDDIPDHTDFEAHRREWFETGTRELAALGGPIRTPDQMMVNFWAETEAFLAPHGVTVLALDAERRLLGSGALRRIAPAVGDLKRLYVRPEARGMRLGRALAEARIEAARTMGLRTLFTNTITSNHRMLEIYEGLGFRRVPRFAECHEPPELDPLLVYLRRDL